MKKVLVLGLLALAASAFSQEQASAWVNSRFGIGLTWDYQAGGNSALFGAFRSNQPGGADPLPHNWYKYGGMAPNCPTPTPMLVPAPAPKVIVPAPGAPVLVPDHHGAMPMAVPMNPTYGYAPSGYVSPYHFATHQRPVYYYYYYPSYAQ